MVIFKKGKQLQLTMDDERRGGRLADVTTLAARWSCCYICGIEVNKQRTECCLHAMLSSPDSDSLR